MLKSGITRASNAIRMSIHQAFITEKTSSASPARMPEELRGEQRMSTLKHLPLLAILLSSLAMIFLVLPTKTLHAQAVIPTGSCGDTVSDDAQLFGSQASNVLNQAQSINSSLKADTRVVTVSPAKLAGSSLQAYSQYILSRCAGWQEPNIILLIMAKGYEPFLHLGSQFSGKMTAADFQQMTFSIKSEFDNGNYAQSAIDLLKQIQKKLSPDYTWLWITIAVVVIIIIAAILAFMVLSRRQRAAAANTAREQANQAKQAAVNTITPLNQKLENLSPRIEVLHALVPATTAAQLNNLFQAAKERTGIVQERLGNLLSNPDTNPNSNALPPERYQQIQAAYQAMYNEAQEPQYLLQELENAVQRLERNPQEPINFQQLVPSAGQHGYLPQTDYPS
jgi:uncharacterized membrane protein YgcG